MSTWLGTTEGSRGSSSFAAVIFYAFPGRIRGQVLEVRSLPYLQCVSPLLIKIFPKSATPSISVALLSVASQNPLPAAPPLRGLCIVPVKARLSSSPPPFAAVILHAGQCAGLSAKTTRSAYAAPSSNTFWRFPLKLPSSGFRPTKSPLMLSPMIPLDPFSRVLLQALP